MKKYVLGVLSLCAALVLTVSSHMMMSKLHAAGVAYLVGVDALGSTAVADGTSTVGFKAYAYDRYCATGTSVSATTCSDGSSKVKISVGAGLKIYVEVGGSSVTLGGVSSDGGGSFVKTGSDGSAQFTLTSAAAGSKTITVSDPDKSNTASASALFTAPAPVAQKPASSTAPKTATPEPVATSVASPETPKTTIFAIDGQQVPTDEEITVPETKSFTIKGTTVPNGVVKLYIFSKPREASVTADAQGNWSYDVAGLEPGAHHVEAEVTDPVTQKVSERKTLVNFKVAKATMATGQPSTAAATKASSLPGIIAGIVVLVIAGGATAWWFLRRRKQDSIADAQEQPAVTVLPETHLPDEAIAEKDDVSGKDAS